MEKLEPVLSEMTAEQKTTPLYEEAVLFLLYHRYDPTQKGTSYSRFSRELSRLLPRPARWKAPHLYAVFHQLRRAYDDLADGVLGSGIFPGWTLST